MPVPTSGAAVRSSGTAWRCMFEPMRARLASSFSRNGMSAVEHGQMVNFMQDNEDGLSSPMLQLKQKLNFGPNDKDNMVFAGFYFADRNIGFRGAEGVVVFASKTSSAFAHMFAVPYVNDNGTNMRLLSAPTDDLSKLYRDMYDSRQVRVDATSGSYRFTSTVNDAKGGVVGCVASIHGPVLTRPTTSLYLNP